MYITKKESKQLRYFARANYKADVKGTVTEDGSKVKHREFPVFGLSYNEAKTDNGMVELTDIQVLYKPFTGTTFAELMDALKDVLGSDDIGEPVKVETIEIPTDNVSMGILPKIPAGLIKNEDECIKALFDKEVIPCLEENIDKSRDSIVTSDAPEKVMEPVIADSVPEGTSFVVERKETDGMLAVTANIVMSGAEEFVDIPIVVNTQKDVVEPVIDAEIVTEDSSNDFVDSVEYATEFIKEQSEPITSVESIHVDTAREGTKDVTGIIDTTGIVKQKKLSRAELNDLRIRCATMRLAESYGEPPETPIGEIVKKYADSAMKLNDLYMADKIKPYTISEEAIREAYPNEYEKCINMSKP